MTSQVSDNFKTQEMCNEAVHNNTYTLGYVPDHLKTRAVCNEVMHSVVNGFMSNAFRHIPDRFKTEGMCQKAVENDPRMPKYVPDHLETQEMYNGAIDHLICWG